MSRNRHLQRIAIVGIPVLLLALMFAAFERRTWFPRTLLRTNGGTPEHLAYSPDGKKIIFADLNRVNFANPASGAILRTLVASGISIHSVSISPDGRKLLTAEHDPDTRVRVWDLQTFRPEKTLLSFTGQDVNFKTAFSPDGRTIVAAGSVTVSFDEVYAVIKAWDAKTFRELWSIRDIDPAIKSYVHHLRFTPSSQEVVYEVGSIIRYRKVATGKLVRNQRNSGGTPSPSGKYVAVAMGRGTINLLDSTGKSLRMLHGDKASSPFAFSADDTLLAVHGQASPNNNNRIFLWDVATGRLVRTLDCGESGVSALAFAPDGRNLAVATDSGAINLWRMK